MANDLLTRAIAAAREAKACDQPFGVRHRGLALAFMDVNHPACTCAAAVVRAVADVVLAEPDAGVIRAALGEDDGQMWRETYAGAADRVRAAFSAQRCALDE